MITKKPKESMAERKSPGDREPQFCSPGSIEQQLDMCEEGNMKGDLVERHVNRRLTPEDPESEDPMETVDEMNIFEVTMAERDREGDEMSGDEHSAGLQGDESELANQPHIDSGIPGSDRSTGEPIDRVIQIHERRTQKKKVAS